MKILVTIVGGNPIANYGIIKHSLNNDKNHPDLPNFDKVALIYSNDTKGKAENFKNLLKEIEFIDIDIKDYARSVSDIEKIVKDTLKNYDIDFIHLNYTGGTKSMSIGAFLAVNDLDIKEKVFSDIDMKEKKLYLKKGEIYPENGNIIDNIKMQIDEILRLNSFDKFNYKTELSEFYNEKFAKFLLDKCLNDEKNFYKDLWDKNFKELKKMNWKKSLENAPIHFDINSLSNKKLEKLQKFIKGLWLENYVFDFLNKNKKNIGFDNCVINLEIIKEKNTQTEIDIAVNKGYDLYIFSCTTGYKKNDVKQKAFEAYKRSEDLGGIGAKAVTVSLATKETIEKIKEDDIKTYTGRNKPDLIGREELLDENKLLNKLKEIIR